MKIWAGWGWVGGGGAFPTPSYGICTTFTHRKGESMVLQRIEKRCLISHAQNVDMFCTINSPTQAKFIFIRWYCEAQFVSHNVNMKYNCTTMSEWTACSILPHTVQTMWCISSIITMICSSNNMYNMNRSCHVCDVFLAADILLEDTTSFSSS